MQKIYKYQLEVGVNNVWMPKNAYVFSVIEQNGNIVAYAIVDTEAEEVQHKFAVLGTGWDASEIVDNLDYGKPYYTFLGTVKTGVYVWHVFYDLSSGE